MMQKISVNGTASEPKLSQISDNKFLLEIDSDEVQFTLRLTKTQVQTLGLKCVQFISDPNINPRFNNINDEDVYRIPLQGLIHLGDREIQTIIAEGDIGDIKIFLWYMQSSEKLVNHFLDNMPKRCGDMVREDLKAGPEEHPDTASSGYLQMAREATMNLTKIINRLQSCGEIGKF